MWSVNEIVCALSSFDIFRISHNTSEWFTHPTSSDCEVTTQIRLLKQNLVFWKGCKNCQQGEPENPKDKPDTCNPITSTLFYSVAISDQSQKLLSGQERWSCLNILVVKPSHLGMIFCRYMPFQYRPIPLRLESQPVPVEMDESLSLETTIWFISTSTCLSYSPCILAICRQCA